MTELSRLIFAAIIVLFGAAFPGSAQRAADPRLELARFEKKIESGKGDEIDRDLLAFVIANPKNAGGFALLAKLRLRQARLTESRSLAKKALTIDPAHLPAKITLVEALLGLGERVVATEALGAIADAEMKTVKTRIAVAEIAARSGDCRRALGITDRMTPAEKNSAALPLRFDCAPATGDLLTMLPAARALARRDASAAIRIAATLSRSELVREAAELLRIAIVTVPADTQMLLALALYETRLKDFKNAETRLARVRKSIPDSPELAFVNAVLETEKGNSKIAVSLLERALSAEPDNIDYLRQFVIVAMRAGQPAAGARAAERLTALRPDELEYVYLLGAAALQANSLAKAEASLVRYTIARPADSRGCLALGLTYAAQAEKLDLGRRQMEQCLVINPRNFEAAYQLGLFYKTQGEIAKSQQYLELTISISPDYGAALRDLGSVYLQSGAEAKARPVLEKAVRLLPNDAETHFQLSRMYNVLGERELGRKHLEIFQSLRTPKKDGME